MADRQDGPDRQVVRSFERHRLEEQLVAMAYEQIRPVIRRRLGKAAARSQKPGAAIRTRTSHARSA
jgi:hypothetical protein